MAPVGKRLFLLRTRLENAQRDILTGPAAFAVWRSTVLRRSSATRVRIEDRSPVLSPWVRYLASGPGVKPS